MSHQTQVQLLDKLLKDMLKLGNIQENFQSCTCLSVQALNVRQAAKHSAEVDELLLELSKQNAAAQAAQTTPTSEVANPLTSQEPRVYSSGHYLPQDGATPAKEGQAEAMDRLTSKLNQANHVDLASTSGRSPTPPRLTTPNSPARRPHR